MSLFDAPAPRRVVPAVARRGPFRRGGHCRGPGARHLPPPRASREAHLRGHVVAYGVPPRTAPQHRLRRRQRGPGGQWHRAGRVARGRSRAAGEGPLDPRQAAGAGRARASARLGSRRLARRHHDPVPWRNRDRGPRCALHRAVLHSSDDTLPAVTAADAARRPAAIGWRPSRSDAVQRWAAAPGPARVRGALPPLRGQLSVRFTRLSLSSASTRWGSAGADGAIRLIWRLIHFAMPSIDYVVAHELAHLREITTARHSGTSCAR